MRRRLHYIHQHADGLFLHEAGRHAERAVPLLIRKGQHGGDQPHVAKRQAVVPDDQRFEFVQPGVRRLVAAELERPLEIGNDRIKGAIDVERRALKPQRARAFRLQALEKRAGDATLAEARLPRQQHGLAGPLIADRLPAREQNLHLVRSSDEGRHRLPDGSVEPADGRADSHHAVRARRRGNALQIELAQILIVEFPAGQPVDALAHDDAARLGDALQAGREVHGFADDVALAWRHHDNSRGNSDSHLETPDRRHFQVGYRLDDLQRRPDRPGSLALVRQGKAEKGQDAIAQEPIDVTVIAADAGLAGVFVLPDNGLQELGIDLQGQLREPDQIAKQHRELAALAFRRHDGQ